MRFVGGVDQIAVTHHSRTFLATVLNLFQRSPSARVKPLI